MDVTNLAICGISIPLFIQITVGLAKKLNFPSKFCPHLSAGIGLVCGVGFAFINAQPWYFGAMAGIMLGALACGVYDGSKGTTDITE